ncbi:DUF551 domain-containing protein [Enterobacter hormaechei]|uniref:DUF551 domain-containing protein n=1 Tax=Enterobacter hormaechei TaxID=158836 RepID=UPI000F87DD97|nr:DUF551 domain-containing protein [Enterobacter hormaechei]MCE1440939.1 DUF551 domain-containing protein [Enterobacter hormaechei]RTP54684.1 DUF551 domain-containing protein [Enterobacter hormaechei]HDS2351718.1 DUF551 domain-containing protein [Enterobacter hormaechei subsp. xiangfangensis]
MAELTKEWLLKTITELEEERDAVPGAVNEDAANALAAMKLSLASLEAEAVAYMIGGHYLMHAQDPKVDNYTSAVPLYTAPPAPVSVPFYFLCMLTGRAKYLRDKGEIKSPELLERAAAMLQGAEPVSNRDELPDGWVACSERMPEVGVKVLCFPVNDEPIHATYNGQVWLQDISWSVSDEPIDNVISCNVFHWMPLPAAPQQEVK